MIIFGVIFLYLFKSCCIEKNVCIKVNELYYEYCIIYIVSYGIFYIEYIFENYFV